MSNNNLHSHTDIWLDIAKERNEVILREKTIARELRKTRLVETGYMRQRIGRSLHRLGDVLTRIGEQMEYAAPSERLEQPSCQICQPDPSWR